MYSISECIFLYNIDDKYIFFVIVIVETIYIFVQGLTSEAWHVALKSSTNNLIKSLCCTNQGN